NETALAIFTERLSLAMNQRGQLYKAEPLYQIVTNSGNQAAIASFGALLESVPWAVYRVRRIYKAKTLHAGEGKQRRVIGSDPTKKGRADRCVEKLETCSSAKQAILRLRELAKENTVEPYQLHGLWYAHMRRSETQYPTPEDFLVAAPA